MPEAKRLCSPDSLPHMEPTMLKPPLRIILPSLLTITLILSSCEKQGDDVASDTQTSAKPLNTDQGTPPSHSDAPPTIETFATQLTRASCDWIQRCKNEELVREVQGSMTMVMALSAPVMRPDLKGEITATTDIFKKVKDDNRLRVTPEECDTIMTTASKVVHLDSASLAASVKEKRAQFVEGEATRCLEAFRDDSKLCGVESKADLSKPYVAAEAKYTAQFQALTAPCKKAVTGLVEVGDRCEESYECKGEDTKCNFTTKTCR